jgi:hypothetical protein
MPTARAEAKLVGAGRASAIGHIEKSVSADLHALACGAQAVATDHNPVVIVRWKGEAAVLVALADWRAG